MAVFMRIRKSKKYEERKFIRDDRYKELVRFDKGSVEYLSTLFLQDSNETRGGAVSPVRKMEVFLRYLSDPGFQNGVAEDFGLHRTTVNKIFNDVLKKITSKAGDWIHFPQTADEVNDAKEKWRNKFKMPSVIGIVDCTHVEIAKPKAFGDSYINRKGYASLNVQVTCNSEEKITSIEAEWPGSTHDSRIWRRSNICKEISPLNGAVCLLADSGYGIAPWLLTPFTPAETREQRIFNKIHAKERVTIERVFGQIKRRFPILGNLIRVKLENVPKIVVACAMLHNIGKTLRDEYNPDEDGHEGQVYEEDGEIQVHEEDEQITELELRRRGQAKRNEVMAILLQML